MSGYTTSVNTANMKAAQGAFKDCAAECDRIKRIMDEMVADLHLAWRGPVAQRFQMTMQDWNERFRRVTDGLTNMDAMLGETIKGYEISDADAASYTNH